jgi:hypothetical protein
MRGRKRRNGIFVSIQTVKPALKRFYQPRPIAARERSLWGHEHRERHLDEFFIFVDRLQRAAHISNNLGRVALLDPKRGSMMAASRAS